MSNLLEIHIDDQTFEVEPGTMIIEVADQAGITIPRFCYHKKLPIAANCRMCLVDVEKSGKPLPACATPVTHGMVVRTHSPKALEAQRSVMEFLLINHPLDCPICDQGGQCELQDLAMGYGKDISRYHEGKRSVHDKNLGSLIATDMTRCIHCTRCVRFGQEIAGVPELGTIGRGEHTEISTYIEKSLDSELSGNIIDLCPVGALTSKPFRFTARPWELEQSPSIAPHDCLGSHIALQHRRGVVMRVAPRECENLNETWLSDRDRFSYTSLMHEERLQTPMIKVHGAWQETDWPTALSTAIKQLSLTIKQHGQDAVGAQIHPSSTVEECYLLQKWLRGLGVNNIDHRISQAAPSQKPRHHAPGFNAELTSLNKQDVIILIGSYLQREQPLISLRVRQSTFEGGKVVLIGSVDPQHNFTIAGRVQTKPSELAATLARIVTAVATEAGHTLAPDFPSLTPTNEDIAIAKILLTGQKRTILVGQIAQNHQDAELIEVLAQTLSELISAQFGLLTQGANSAGAWLAGAVPQQQAGCVAIDKPGLSSQAQWQAKLKAYILVNVEPELDSAFPSLAKQALTEAETVICVTPFVSAAMLEYADVLLPAATFAETAGTFVNIEHNWQPFQGAILPPGQARPIWKILRVLGNLSEQVGFEYTSAEEVLAEVKNLCDKAELKPKDDYSWPKAIASESCENLERITFWPIYRVDMMTRRSEALQQSATAEPACVWIHPDMAEKLGLTEGELAKVTATMDEHSMQLPVRLTPRIAAQTVYIPAGFSETAFGSAFGSVRVERSQS